MGVQAEAPGATGKLPTAGMKDTLAFTTDVTVPTLSKGVIIRRPRMVRLAERMDLDARGVRRLQRLRARYGPGPLMLAIPGRRQAVLLSSEDVRRVLDGTPRPFSPASYEKRAALAHLEPRASLISIGPERAERRRFNEVVLESERSAHGLAGAFFAAVEEEVRSLLDTARERGLLSWDAFVACWYKIVRRVVLGSEARDDHELTAMLAGLRAAANWAFLHPGRDRQLERFHERLRDHLRRAEPGSLAQVIATTPTTAQTAPADQVAHWFFAFDPAGMATFRALALIVAHPGYAARAHPEIDRAAGASDVELPFLRACILESLRLWPTTPVVLRESTEPTRWANGTMPEQTSIIIFAPFFHRDDETLEHAHRFHPDLWLGERAQQASALIPFSGGPGICPARHLVPMLGSATLAALLRGARLRPKHPGRLDPPVPLPGTLDNHTLAFTLAQA